MTILGFPLFDILDQNKKFGQEKNLLKFLLVMSSSRSDFMSLSSFVRCLYPYFYFEALEANFYVLMLEVFH